MGCDIHLYVEHKDSNGRWWKCDDGFESDYYDKDNDYFSQERYKDGDSPYSGRNYTVFAYLANVRNGRGFAGCDTGDAIKPIAEPKGLPKDVSLTLQDKSDSWGIDGHSHSYFTLQELRDAAFEARHNEKVTRGWVNKEEYLKFLAHGQPDSWSGDIGGGNIMKISNGLMNEYMEHGYPDSKSYYTQVGWKNPLFDNVGHFFDHVIPQLEKKQEYEEAEAIRIVFWFDN